MAKSVRDWGAIPPQMEDLTAFDRAVARRIVSKLKRDPAGARALAAANNMTLRQAIGANMEPRGKSIWPTGNWMLHSQTTSGGVAGPIERSLVEGDRVIDDLLMAKGPRTQRSVRWGVPRTVSNVASSLEGKAPRVASWFRPVGPISGLLTGLPMDMLYRGSKAAVTEKKIVPGRDT